MSQRQEQLQQQQGRENTRYDPVASAQPLPLARNALFAHIQHHDDEDEQHHNRAGVDHDLQRRGEGRSHQEEQHCHRQQRHNQVDQGMGGIGPGECQHRRQQGDQRGQIEECCHHGSRLFTSIGGASLRACPLSLPFIARPDTR